MAWGARCRHSKAFKVFRRAWHGNLFSCTQLQGWLRMLLSTLPFVCPGVASNGTSLCPFLRLDAKSGECPFQLPDQAFWLWFASVPFCTVNHPAFRPSFIRPLGDRVLKHFHSSQSAVSLKTSLGATSYDQSTRPV